MWWSDRRTFLTAAAAALGGCGFAPVYAPQGAGGRLQNQIDLGDPDGEEEYLFARRFEERLGRGSGGAYRLDLTIDTSRDSLGTTSAGSTTRYRLDGTAAYTLRDAATDKTLLEGSSVAFTGYSATGSTVATLAAERDARERLMVILADQVIDEILLNADPRPA